MLAYLEFLLRGGFTLDVTFTPSVWYLMPYLYRNPNIGSGIRWTFFSVHCRFVYYKDWKQNFKELIHA